MFGAQADGEINHYISNESAAVLDPVRVCGSNAI